ncbi:hypothetical protein GQE99_05315 [Maritimibacter sp. DP07]|jgi:hypothetical protein|uniref:DUF2946 domain-containing protein n=1 Tax=Maritimibacter harenae TaxID=2606218 RepID=A0A845M4M8_9RHOB|nr:hypothetical protein [Maritimibacter harenae]MZR12433.1 hypothetical protein [Maritimibacter harenae]
MKPVLALSLSLIVAVAGVLLAGAKGAPAGMGQQIVICTGMGIKTITLGADGEPVEEVDLCPEAHSIFAQAADMPPVPVFAPRAIGTVEPAGPAPRASRDELEPSARGPPRTV